jgi:hypothetical protein
LQLAASFNKTLSVSLIRNLSDEIHDIYTAGVAAVPVTEEQRKQNTSVSLTHTTVFSGWTDES